MPYRLGLTLMGMVGKCPLCRLAPIEVGCLCQGCDDDIAWLPDPFQINLSDGKSLSVQSASYYDDTMRRAISAFKDSENLFTLPLLVQACHYLGQAVSDMPDDTLIVPVPTTNKRIKERGFYPVGVLAKWLSNITGYRIYNGVYRFEGIRQRGLSRNERLSNMTQAFEVDYLPDSDFILLVDDVSTTGATFLAMAQALLHTDKNLQIQAVCLAHGKNPRQTTF